MDSNDELKEIDIENRACCYFDDLMKIEDFKQEYFNRWKTIQKYFSL